MVGNKWSRHTLQSASGNGLTDLIETTEIYKAEVKTDIFQQQGIGYMIHMITGSHITGNQ